MGGQWGIAADDKQVYFGVNGPRTAQGGMRATTIEEVAAQGVLERAEPVHLHRAADVAHRVEQGVFIRFDEADGGVVEMRGDPVGIHEVFGMGIVHVKLPPRAQVGEAASSQS